jgi:archaellum component FlaD/FlaE
MNTVREENKQIGETVDELDDTIRKLLDIYEMVTRGINPFVDDAREMGGLEHGDGAFGLFDSEEDDEEDLDPDVANADAESFFDEDFGELDADAGEVEAEQAAEDELAEAEPEEPAMLDDPDDTGSADAESDGAGGGVSFDDLKAEYEEGDGWDDVESLEPKTAAADPLEAEDEDAESPAGPEEPDLEGDDAAGDAANDEDADEDAEGGETTGVENPVSPDSPRADVDVDVEEGGADDSPGADEKPVPATEADDTDPETPAPDERSPVAAVEASAPPAETVEASIDDEMFSGLDESDGDDTGSATESSVTTEEDAVTSPRGRERLGSSSADDSDAHLSTLPATYAAESVAMEWMRFLVAVGGPLGAARALRQYQDFGWISSSVRTTLDTYVRLAATARDDERNESLTLDHHETSLRYVRRLGGSDPDATVMEPLVADGGSQHGIRR